MCDSAKAAGAAAASSAATRKELYAEARRRNIPGRSRMSKSQLEHALSG
ncbi:MAG: hypothetical protein ACREFK_09495 [Stellaceae bacterium]